MADPDRPRARGAAGRSGPAPAGSRAATRPRVPADPAIALAGGRRERNKARTRERIVQAATDLFNRYGYDAVTVDDIAESADIALRTYYHYFDSKAAVALARFHQWMDDLGDALAGQPPGLSPPEALAAALAATAEQGYAGERRLRSPAGQPLLPTPAAVLFAESDPEVAGLVYQRLVQAFHRMSDLFADRLGYPAGAAEPQAIASAVVALWFVVVHGGPGPADAGINDTALRALAFYSTGLSGLWERPGTSPSVEATPRKDHPR
ncbi:MAG TPA: TetR/AcrR family transcriptional regulator [Acidimicrobiales bacterium]|nr:TetR/AcrR family transcriptional regulator [Acidimicrobiales bacterium]